MSRTDDLNVENVRPLISPWVLIEEHPATSSAESCVTSARECVREALSGRDDRLVVVVGPCSVHDVAAAKEYGARLKGAAERLKEDLVVVMRVYFEKPRTTVGWCGAINDPDLDGSFGINKGLRMARALLADLNDQGIPCGCEFLDTITPQYISDLVTWGAIGARTTESQVHRQLASGMSCPVGFKNSTSGSDLVAAQAVISARHRHCFPGVTKEGLASLVTSKGNPDTHIILRGSTKGPNYGREGVAAAREALAKAGVECGIMIDVSHGNSNKDHNRQPIVCAEVAEQVAGGDASIVGVMIESNLVAGRQDVKPAPGARDNLVYGQSITDACVDFETTEKMLDNLAEAVRSRRAGKK